MFFEQEKGAANTYRQKWFRIYRYYAINYHYYEMEMHTHEEWELMYVVHGNCKILYIEDGKERDYHLRSGEYILLKGNTAHSLFVEKGRTCRILNLEGKLEKTNGRFCVEMLEKDAETRNFAQQSRSVILGKDDGRLHDIVTALLEELRSDSGLKANKRGTMQELLLGQFYITIARQNGRDGSAGRVEYIRKAQRFIENHYDQEIGIADVAEETGLSEGYLQRLYKAEKGISIMEEVIRLRIENAKLLLEISTLPVVDVAVQTGFNSRQHFSATFKKTVGCSPAEWRKMRGAVLTTGWEEIT